MEDSEDRLPITGREATAAGHLQDTDQVDMVAGCRGEATAPPLAVDLVGMVRLVVGTAVGKGIAGTSSVKGLVGMMTGMSSALATSPLRFPPPFGSTRDIVHSCQECW